MISILPVSKHRWVGVVALALIAVIMLVAHLRILNAVNSTLAPRTALANSSVAASNPLWGKFVIGPATVSYPSRWAEIRHLFRRFGARCVGTPLYIGSAMSLDHAINFYVFEQIPRPNNFTVYYSPGLDGGSTLISPITKIELSKIRVIAAPLATLLASNGFSIVTLRRNVIKVFPTSMASVYSNAPINEASYPY